MKFTSLHEFLTDYVRDPYNAESQLVKALPKMAKAATSPDLRAAFTEHLEQTRRTGEDDDSDAAAPSPRGETPGKARRRLDKTVTRRGSKVLSEDRPTVGIRVARDSKFPPAFWGGAVPSERSCDMRTWIKVASLTLVAALAAGARAQDKPRNDDRPRDDSKSRTTEDRTRTTQERTRTDDATRGEEKALTDTNFVDHAYTAGQNELLLAKLALQRSRNEDVRRFAAKMIEDHAKCGNDLIILVSEQRIAIPDRPLPEQEKDLRR
ncbi:MAG TPA: DUF892 family protein, partial [Gemmataceae bacterium]|nr:DUF892 family protein [Gemmataceae bacterium]